VTDYRTNSGYTANGNYPGVYYQGSNVWDLDFGFTIKAPALAWDTNGVNLEALLPVVTINQNKVLDPGRPKQRIITIPAADNTKISIIYGVPDAHNYDWTGGPAPYSVTSANATSDAEATWYEQLNTLNEPTPVSATNNSAAGLDSLRTFIAGALVGVGGGALVGATQEATQRLENGSSATRSTPPGSAPMPTIPEGGNSLRAAPKRISNSGSATVGTAQPQRPWPLVASCDELVPDSHPADD
jgi:hypothetical protein